MIRLQQVGKGLGSDIALTIRISDESAAASVFDNLWASIVTFEQRFSRFKPDSELTTINHHAGKPTQISTEFAALLKTALEYNASTDGLYNPLVLPDLQRAGYTGSWPDTGQISPTTDYRSRKGGTSAGAISLDSRIVTLPKQAALDFGGIGKGYLLDQLAEQLESAGVNHYWLSLGGDIISAGFDDGGEPWQVGVAQAQKLTEVIAVAANNSGERLAVATSATTKRRGTNWHHLIDPRTGAPATTDVLSATVLAQSGVDADIFAKCLVILGSVASQNFITKHAVNGALVQTTSDTLRYGDLA